MQVQSTNSAVTNLVAAASQLAENPSDQRINKVFQSSIEEFRLAQGSLEPDVKRVLIEKLEQVQKTCSSCFQDVVISTDHTNSSKLAADTIANLILSDVFFSEKSTKKMHQKVVLLIEEGISVKVVRGIFYQAMSSLQEELERVALATEYLTSSNITEERTPERVECVLEDMCRYEVENTLTAIEEIPQEEKMSVMQSAQELIQEGMNGGNIAYILSAVGKLQEEEQESIIQSAQGLIQKGMDGSGIGLILSAVTDIALGERESVIQDAKELIHEGMDGFDIGLILSAIGLIPQEKRESIIQDARRLVQEEMDGIDVVNIFSSTAQGVDECAMPIEGFNA